MTVPDVADYAGSAAFIDSGRVLDNVSGVATPGYTSPTLDVSRFQSVGIVFSWSGSLTPAAQYLVLNWLEAGQNVWQDTLTAWNQQALGGGGSVNYVQAPCIGSQLQLQLARPAASDTLSCVTVGSSRPLPRVRAQCFGDRGSYGQSGELQSSLAAGATDTFYIGPMPGEAAVRFATGGLSMSLTITAQLQVPAGLITPIIWSATTTGQALSGPLVFPPAALKVTVSNGGASAGAYQFAITTSGS